MFFGQVLRAVTGDVSTYFSPWFARQGTRAVFACDYIASVELNFFKIQVQTKKQEDDNESGVVKSVGALATMSAGVTPFLRGNLIDASEAATQGFLDLIRFVYTVKSNSTKRGWVHFRMLDPTWESD